MAMRQQTRLLATLGGTVVVAAGLAAYAYFGVFVAGEEEAAQKEREEKLVTFGRDDVTKLVVTAKGETTVVEKLADKGWTVSSPVAAEADAYAIHNFLDRLVAAKRKTAVKDGADPAKFGFDAPTIRIAATTVQGDEEVVEIGDTNEFDGSRFVRVGGGRMATVGGDLQYALEKTAFDLREKRPWRFETPKVQRIRVEGVEPAWTAARDGGGWKLEAPVAEKADGPAVDRVLNSLSALRATAIPAEAGADGAPFGLAKPRATVTLGLEGGATLRLVLGEVGKDAERKLYARAGDGFVAEVAPRILDDLGPGLFALRDKTIVAFDREAVARLEFDGGETFAVERKKEGGQETFALVEPRQARAKRWKVASALTGLAGLRAAEWVEEDAKDLGKYGLDRPRRTVALKDAAGKELTRLLVGSVDGTRTYVKSGASNRVAKVDTTRIDELPARIADVEDVEEAAAPAD
jgi:hypothetical protein